MARFLYPQAHGDNSRTSACVIDAVEALLGEADPDARDGQLAGRLVT